MIEQILTGKITEAVKNLYQLEASPSQIQLQNTRKEFEGDITLVVFPFTRVSRKSPEATAAEMGEYLQANLAEVDNFNVIKGFLNISIKKEYWLSFLTENYLFEKFGFQEKQDSKPVVVEYSSPNTNKPLHLGHIRNNLLGFSLSRILQAAGKNVVKVNLVNDRGIHICKSMLAWQRWGNGETPESSGLKGDHLVGKYYVVFDKYFKEEIAVLVAGGMNADEASKKAPLIIEAQQILQKWEAGDEEVINLWKKMNGWVYDGFAITYKTLGIEFDKTYYESQTYLLGKELVQEGVQKGVYTRRADGSVWIDLSAEGMDEKLLLRSDGTSVYMTQDLGTAMQRYNEYNPEQLIYVVGNEQEYHFNVLKVVLKHLGCAWADSIYHLSYGMVELPAGKMKSREGTVVDADDLMQEMFDTSEAMARELGKIEAFDTDEARNLYRTIGLGALKYFILKVDPKKNMLFNPAESVDFNGNTGPFIQYTYARIKSVLRKADEAGYEVLLSYDNSVALHPEEKELLRKLHDFPALVLQAADMHSPAVIANYAFELASEYNRFYHELTILKEENLQSRGLRLSLSQFTAKVIVNALWMLGIEVPERM
ncbi:MAG: arginine--tRNA ligase [Bacteroidales bacterium]|nr:arginine--tRNA ligase [Bacteroidales bacterium]